MNEHPGHDYLTVLKGELVEQVRRARVGLDPESGAAVGEPPSAAICVDAMQQLQGVLHTLGLELLVLTAQEVGRVARSLDVLSPEKHGETLGVLRDGLDQLRDAIERRASGRAERVWSLVGVLNELRAASPLPLVSEVCLFAPTLEAELAAKPVMPGSANPELAEVVRRERSVLHRGMYLWYSGREPQRGLRKLRRVTQTLRRAAGTERLRRLFLVLEGVIVGISDQTIAVGGAMRRLLAEIDQLLKDLSGVGEERIAKALPVGLLRNLLFYIATSGSFHRVVQSVRRTSDLRLMATSGFDGREQVVPLVLAEVEQARALVIAHLDEGFGASRSLVPLSTAVQRLSDTLALAHFGDQRRQLEDSVSALRRIADGTADGADPLPELDGTLVLIEGFLRSPESGYGAGNHFAVPLPREDIELAATELEAMEAEVAAADREVDFLARAPGPAGADAEPFSTAIRETDAIHELDDDIREMFCEEASEKVTAMRRDYVAWSAQHEDGASLDAVLEALEGLKATGRLVGADTLSEVCWVLEAALERCREGRLSVQGSVLAVLDEGIETVDALVTAYVRGEAVDGDPRVVEQRLYGLLSSERKAVAGGPPETSLPFRPRDGKALEQLRDAGRGEAGVLGGAGSIDVDLGLVELFAEEAGELADALQDALAGLKGDPARSSRLIDMRRALRALGVAARYARLELLPRLCEVFEAFLGHAATCSGAMDPSGLALTREATDTVRSLIEALRQGRLPQVPASLIDRLVCATPEPTPASGWGEKTARRDDGLLQVEPREQCPTVERPEPIKAPAVPEAVVQRLLERAGGVGLCHLQLEEQVSVLREHVGSLEGTLELLRRLPRAEAAGALPPRVAAALEDLGGCADQLHEASLTISSQLRGQGHQLTELQHGLVAAFDQQTPPTFADLLLVGVGDRVYAIPTSVVDSVRRIASDLIPAQGELLELRGVSFSYNHLADLLAVERSGPPAAGRAQSIVLARVGDGVRAFGVDRVLGHRTLLVGRDERPADDPPGLGPRVSLGGERTAPVVDLAILSVERGS